MMKNWLIRTKNNHILGPLSKDKVRELYYSNSIKEQDEICSGNGYWFYIKEKDLVEKYLIGDTKQSFNIVSEASSVLTIDNIPTSDEQLEVEDEAFIEPTIDDLEYPEMDSFDTSEVSLESDVIPMTRENNIDLDISQLAPDQSETVVNKKVKKKGDLFLYIVALFFLAMAIFAFLNRKKIIGQFLSQVSFVSTSYAQELTDPNSFVKKNFIIRD